MGKIDLDKLILSLRKSCDGVSGRNVAMLRDGIDKLLFAQALEYKNGEIVSIFDLEPADLGTSNHTKKGADAFIEKIENYLNSQLYDWVSITNPDQMSHPNVIPKKDFIEDFKDYMKGE